MSTVNKLSKMSVRLWLIMMTLVVFTVAAMWTVQIIILESSHIKTEEDKLESSVAAVSGELTSGDLVENIGILSYLGKTASEKILIADANGELIAVYAYGHPVDMEREPEDNIIMWEMIKKSDEYDNITVRKPYSREICLNRRVYAYETGLPVTYNGTDAYLILYRSFSDLHKVIDINRRQLILLSILLTLASAVLAAILTRKFIKPVYIIKNSIDELAKGNLDEIPDLKLKDEMGRLAESVKELSLSLQRVDKLRKEVIANVSHELRSPLALIGGYAEMARDIHRSDDEKRTGDLDLIISESNRMSEMVSDILDYSQLRAGYMKLNRDLYNLCEIAESEIMHCKKSADEYDIKIKFAADKDEILISADAPKICRVIRNLLYNAINHTKNNGVVTVEIHSENNVRVDVKNPGESIPEQDRALIWERYRRSQHRGGRHAGTGIGLSIVSAILDAHEMKYGVDCADGITSFWLEYETE
ncbi:MAG: HAMP domain-containing histidine kinase [Oscillospiraceae bacterium]|nr:HAMP domain-containing histidine kinase [Oscillospiraceae bacterium]